MTDGRNRSDTLLPDRVWSGLSKPFKSQPRHLRPSREKAFKQPPKQPPAFLLCRLIWNRTPLLCYFKHIISLLLNQKILSDLKKKMCILKYDALQSAADVAKGTVLLHGPEHRGKPGTHLSVTLSGSDPLALRGKKPLGASREGQPGWERTTATPGIHPVTAVPVGTGCELGDEGWANRTTWKTGISSFTTRDWVAMALPINTCALFKT